MSTDGLGSYSEHHFRKVIPGDLEAVGRRLAAVLEEFNYVVLSENPIQARRAQVKNVLVSTILDCETRLTIALKPISAASTLATFNYTVAYLYADSDRVVLEREADAMIALASVPAGQSFCRSCGAPQAEAVRFCRSCGAPVARNRLPAELEVMRLSASGSTAWQEITTGAIICLLALLGALAVNLWGKPKTVAAIWWVLAIGESLGFLILFYGLRRLRRSLDAPPAAAEETPARRLAGEDRAALPAPPASVTENTTALIDRPEKLPSAVQAAKDTDAM